MKIEDIERELPNGFHDAELQNIFIDYDKYEAIFEIKVWIGDINSESRELLETYRRGQLKLYGLRYCVIEAPDPRYHYYDRELTIDAGTVNSLRKAPEVRLPELPSEEVFSHWFFVRQWNAFIYVTASNARFDWIEKLPLESDNEQTG